jgi:hypothetical protein
VMLGIDQPRLLEDGDKVVKVTVHVTDGYY